MWSMPTTSVSLMVRSELAQLNDEMEKLASGRRKAAVSEDDLARVIELWTGIPASKVKEERCATACPAWRSAARKKSLGRTKPSSWCAAAVRRSRVQHQRPARRPASFLFVGPTGVGKTELVKALAAELFDTAETLIRLDMSEFMEKHSVSRIIGSPPGYVGYDEAGQLTEKVRRKPYSVVLFDEIEKAHPDVLNILLQILDDGRITDAQGRTVNFENTVIRRMTSNAGSERRENAMGFGKTSAQANRDKVMKALKDFLRPEFISRVDEVVIFGELSLADYERIAVLMLEELVEPLKEKGITLTWDDATIHWLAEHSHGGGAARARPARPGAQRRWKTASPPCYVRSLRQSLPSAIAVVPVGRTGWPFLPFDLQRPLHLSAKMQETKSRRKPTARLLTCPAVGSFMVFQRP